MNYKKNNKSMPIPRPKIGGMNEMYNPMTIVDNSTKMPSPKPRPKINQKLGKYSE